MSLPLGKSVTWPVTYDPSVLYRVARPDGRTRWHGVDRWTCFELTWLSPTGMPQAAILSIDVPARSPYLVESKSLKLYLGSFAAEELSSDKLCATIASDLSTLLEMQVNLRLWGPTEWESLATTPCRGVCLDNLDVTPLSASDAQSALRCAPQGEQTEVLYSNLFRSLCPVTSQPDYATVGISYCGKPIVREALLQYLVSFRDKQGFHEACCEEIYDTISSTCSPSSLVVECRFTRRGGIDINPLRCSSPELAQPLLGRTWRQ